MAINLIKTGHTVTLTKDNPSLRNLIVGLKWGGKKGGLLSALFGAGDVVDVDSSVLVTDGKGRKIDLVFYAKRIGQGIRHAGDDRTGYNKFGKEDNEEIYIDLRSLPPEANELYIIANIFSGASDFSKVKGSYMRLIDADKGEEMVRYELDDFKGMGSVVLGKLYIQDRDWKFRAIGAGMKTRDLNTVVRNILSGY
jgi:tellurium resistance protein TerD